MKVVLHVYDVVCLLLFELVTKFEYSLKQNKSTLFNL